MQVSLTVLLIGLSNSGKTTILRSLCNKTQQIFPTAGFDITYVNVGVRSVLVYDCSGEGHSRETWTMLYENCDVVCYVIDAQDSDIFSIAKQTLLRFLQKNRSMKYKCIKIEKNPYVQNRVQKQILYQGLEIQKIQKMVNKIYIKQTSAYTKEGLEECFDWMSKNGYAGAN